MPRDINGTPGSLPKLVHRSREEVVAVVVDRNRGFFRVGGYGNDSDADGEEDYSCPALATEGPAEQEDGEDCCGEDLGLCQLLCVCVVMAVSGTHLQLVQDLEMYWIQVAQSHVLQRVLEGVQGCRDRQFPPIAAKHRTVYLFEEYCGRRLRRKAPRDIVEGKSGGDGELDDLVEKDCRAREVSVVTRWLHYPTVMHYL